MAETTIEVVLEGYRQARETARLVEVPLVALTVVGAAPAAELAGAELECPVVVMRRIVEPPFAQTHERRTVGPLFVIN
jgi:hypothetical protein